MSESYQHLLLSIRKKDYQATSQDFQYLFRYFKDKIIKAVDTMQLDQVVREIDSCEILTQEGEPLWVSMVNIILTQPKRTALIVLYKAVALKRSELSFLPTTPEIEMQEITSFATRPKPR